MSTKLTLTMDETVIRQAKSYAKLQESSLSSIIENYLKSLVKDKSTSKNEFSPIVKSLKSGLVCIVIFLVSGKSRLLIPLFTNPKATELAAVFWIKSLLFIVQDFYSKIIFSSVIIGKVSTFLK